MTGRRDVVILLVGCGNMGFSMLQGWLREGVPAGNVHVVEPLAALRLRAAESNVNVYTAPDHLAADLLPGVVLIAVKPQVISAVVPLYRRFAQRGATVLAIAAGTLISTYESLLGPHTAIIRCMPNTPAAIGEGMIVCCANRHVDETRREICDALLCSSGPVAFLEDEALMDAVTAVSGSGPAYVFHFIEALTGAGITVGLSPSLARQLAIQTVYGAAALARQSNKSAADLRHEVTSPNGTTAAALQVLMRQGSLQRLVTEAVMAAAKRSHELAHS